MTKRLWRFLRQNTIALIALFIALGGTTYAATGLPRNSVGSKQLKKNAVTSIKIKKGAVTAAKINANGLIVPNALHATSADSATNATNATDAANASHASAADTAGTAGANVYYHNSQNGGVGLTGPTNLTRVGSLTLPQGTFLVTAKQVVDAPAGGTDTECYLYAGATQTDHFYAVLPGGYSVPMTGTAALVLSGTTQVSDECEGTAATAVGNEAMWAIQVGSGHSS